MLFLLLLHAVLGILGLGFAARLGRRGLLLGIVGPLATAIWLIARLPRVLGGHPVVESVQWMPALGMNLDLRLDGFSALMVALVAGIGVAVYAYALSYFPAVLPPLGRVTGKEVRATACDDLARRSLAGRRCCPCPPRPDTVGNA